jgi:hypothetical protein
MIIALASPRVASSLDESQEKVRRLMAEAAALAAPIALLQSPSLTSRSTGASARTIAPAAPTFPKRKR